MKAKEEAHCAGRLTPAVGDSFIRRSYDSRDTTLVVDFVKLRKREKEVRRARSAINFASFMYEIGLNPLWRLSGRLTPAVGDSFIRRAYDSRDTLVVDFFEVVKAKERSSSRAKLLLCMR